MSRTPFLSGTPAYKAGPGTDQSASACSRISTKKVVRFCGRVRIVVEIWGLILK